MTTTSSSLDDVNASELKSIFSEHTVLTEEKLTGVFEAEILGSPFIRAVAKLSLPLAGLAGWYGKRIEAQGAVNLVSKPTGLKDSVPMLRRIENSYMDGKPCLVLSYDRSSPLLLRPMRDEFRQLDDDILLGFSIYNLPVLRNLALPFLLKRSAS